MLEIQGWSERVVGVATIGWQRQIVQAGNVTKFLAGHQDLGEQPPPITVQSFQVKYRYKYRNKYKHRYKYKHKYKCNLTYK